MSTPATKIAGPWLLGLTTEGATARPFVFRQAIAGAEGASIAGAVMVDDDAHEAWFVVDGRLGAHGDEHETLQEAMRQVDAELVAREWVLE